MISDNRKKEVIMDDKIKTEKIEAAIKAHIGWFEKLRSAIATGKSDFNPVIVAKDDQCEFGKWIYSDLKNICDQAKYDRIKTLHINFHKKASEILKLAIDRKKEMASSQITTTSDLGRLSGELILVLRKL
jgi:hypothetical protein